MVIFQKSTKNDLNNTLLLLGNNQNFGYAFIKSILSRHENFSKLSPFSEKIFEGKNLSLVFPSEGFINSSFLSDFLYTPFTSSLVCASVSYDQKKSILFSSLANFVPYTYLKSISKFFDVLFDEKTHLLSLYIFSSSKELLNAFYSYILGKGLKKIKVEFVTLTQNPSVVKEVLISNTGKIFFRCSNSKKELLIFKLNLFEDKSVLDSLLYLSKPSEVKINFV